MQRSNWPLCRILETYQGANDVVRTVKLKTWNGEMIRPASKWFMGEGGCSDITELFTG